MLAHSKSVRGGQHSVRLGGGGGFRVRIGVFVGVLRALDIFLGRQVLREKLVISSKTLEHLAKSRHLAHYLEHVLPGGFKKLARVECNREDCVGALDVAGLQQPPTPELREICQRVDKRSPGNFVIGRASNAYCKLEADQAGLDARFSVVLDRRDLRRAFLMKQEQNE